MKTTRKFVAVLSIISLAWLYSASAFAGPDQEALKLGERLFNDPQLAGSKCKCKVMQHLPPGWRGD